MFRLMERHRRDPVKPKTGESTARRTVQLPIPNLVLAPVVEAGVCALFVWVFLVLLAPFALHDVPVSARLLEAGGYATAVFLGVLTVNTLLDGTELGSRPPSDGFKQLTQNSLRIVIICGLNTVVGSYFDMESLTPLLLLRYLGMTVAVGVFSLISILLMLWFFWSGGSLRTLPTGNRSVLLQSPETSASIGAPLSL